MLLLLLKAMHLNCQKSLIILRRQNFIMEVGLWLTCGSSRCLIWQVKNNHLAFELNFRKWRTLEQFSKYFAEQKILSLFLKWPVFPWVSATDIQVAVSETWLLVWTPSPLCCHAFLSLSLLQSDRNQARLHSWGQGQVKRNKQHVSGLWGGNYWMVKCVCEPQKATKVSKTDGALVLVKQEKKPFVLLSFAPLS